MLQEHLHLRKEKHVQTRGLNWASLAVVLQDGCALNIVTSYTKHGHELEARGTFTQVRECIDTFTIPYVWGGDFNRAPKQLES